MNGRTKVAYGVLVAILVALVAAPAQAGLIGYWDFEDGATVTDVTGNGHDGTFINGSAFSSAAGRRLGSTRSSPE